MYWVLQYSPARDAVQSWQNRVAWIIFVLSIVGFVVATYTLKYRIRSREERRQLNAIRPQVVSATPAKAYLRHATPGVERRRTVSQLFDKSSTQPLGVRGSLRNLRGELAGVFAAMPRGTARVFGEIVLLVGIAVVSLLAVVTVESWLVPSGEIGGAATLLEWIVVGIVAIGVGIGTLLRSTPGGEYLLALRDPVVTAAVAWAMVMVLLLLWVIAGRTADADDILARVFEVVFAVGRVVGAVLICILGAIVLVDGHLAAAIGTLVAAGPLVWVGTVAAVILGLAILRALAPDSTGEVGRSLQRTVNDAAVRTRWLVFAAPVLLVVLAILIIAAWTESWVATVVGAALVGIVTRLVLVAYARLRYRFVETVAPVECVDEVAVTGYTIEDVDGHLIYVAGVDGYELAHRDREELVETVLDAADWRLHGPPETSERTALVEATGREAPRDMPALEHWYYEEAIEHGRVDFEAVTEELRGDIETRVTASLRENGAIERSQLEDDLRQEYPATVVHRSLEWLTRETAQVKEVDGRLELR